MDPMLTLNKIEKVIDLKIELKSTIPLWEREEKFVELEKLMAEIRSECKEYREQMNKAQEIINRYSNTLEALSK